MCLLWSQLAHGDPPACSLKLIMNTRIAAISTGIFVPSLVNGWRGYLQLDTGATFNVISPQFIGTLPPMLNREFAVGGLAPGDMWYSVLVPSVTYGSQTVYGHQFYVALQPLAPDHHLLGFLSAGWLNWFDFEYDPHGSSISYFSRDHCPGEVVHWPHTNYAKIPLHMLQDNRMAIPVRIDGHDLWAIIDTGATDSARDLGAAKSFFGIKPGEPGVQEIDGVGTVNGARITAYRHQFDSMTLEGVTFSHPWIGLTDETALHSARARHSAERAGDPVPDMLLGMHQLSQLHLYFAFGEQLLYATTVADEIEAAKKTSALPAP
jgi:hypothetical protein